MTIHYPKPPILERIPPTGHALIEASAGTGKTYTIEHLIVDLLLSGACRIEEILVVTFTERATTELRERVRRMIERIWSGSGVEETSSDTVFWEVDDRARHLLEQALFAFDRAPISTIHGFCHRVLSEMAFDCGSRFDLELVDGRDLFHRAFREALRDELAVESASRSLLDEWLRTADLDALEKLLWEAHRARYLDTLAEPGRDVGKALRTFRDLFEPMSLGKAYETLQLTTKGKTESSKTIIDLVGAADAESNEDLRRQLAAVDLKPLLEPTRKKDATAPFPDSLPPKIRELIAALESLATVVGLEPRIADVFLPAITARADRIKNERSLVDFDDMLRRMRDALTGRRGDALAATLRRRYRVALIDEFQDTDELQWEIFRRIFVEAGGANRLFLIGDPKQAIYSFRGADVHAYLSAREAITASGAPPITLADNYRSTSLLIEATNTILADDAREPFFAGEIRYQDPVRCARPKLRAIDGRGAERKPLTLFRFDPGEEDANAPSIRRAFGRKIAVTIRDLLFDPKSSLVLEEDGIRRALSPEEIFILVRSKDDGVTIADYLRELGIPHAFYKLEGLFQTDEARDIRDVLRAIEDPASRQRRLNAWLSPFFDIPLRELQGCMSLTDGHPLNESLRRWHVAAEDASFAELFESLAHDSGLVARELFLANSERELTNYLHILEVLLEEGIRRHASFADLIALLDSWIEGRALPAGVDGNVQRLESERKAVQIMTVHKAKGLEADVVFLYGGFYGWGGKDDPLKVWHDGHERQIALGKTAIERSRAMTNAEDDAENRRLLYVAMTRPRALLYLPWLPEDCGARKLTGYYEHLNARLCALAGDAKFQKLVTIEKAVDDGGAEPAFAAGLRKSIAAWMPPAAILDDDEPASLEKIAKQHAPLETLSFTSILRKLTASRSATEVDDRSEDIDDPEAQVAEDVLPGGRAVGRMLHEAIESLPLESLVDRGFDVWASDTAIAELFQKLARRHRLLDEPALARAKRIVFDALTLPLPIGGTPLDGGLFRSRPVRELEFLYPIPEEAHPLFARPTDGAWTVERGFVRGYVDLVFQSGGLTYFADWKSDFLRSYDAAAIARRVADHYELQAQIYAIGVVRLLGIRDEESYRSRFGGLLYLFLRGLSADGAGVYFKKPTWAEICAFERELMKVDVEAGA